MLIQSHQQQNWRLGIWHPCYQLRTLVHWFAFICAYSTVYLGTHGLVYMMSHNKQDMHIQLA